jgi:threonyl-tRNA synthetase
MRHSTAHVLAKAVQRLYPGSALGIGPVIQDGFYYDIDVANKQLSIEDLPAIEEEMRRLIAADEPFTRREITRDVAIRESRERNEPYKLEIIESVPTDETLSFYDTGSDWTDLCRGRTSPVPGRSGPFKLLNVAGAYWRGDEKRPMLQRIYGTAWETQAELEPVPLSGSRRPAAATTAASAASWTCSASPRTSGRADPLAPEGRRGAIEAEEFARKTLAANGYEWVFTPHIGRSKLWETSGHLGFYKENMYSAMDIEGEDYYAKPMNCPFHIQIYRNHIRSYRDLPQRYAEYGTVYRYERSGVLTA